MWTSCPLFLRPKESVLQYISGEQDVYPIRFGSEKPLEKLKTNPVQWEPHCVVFQTLLDFIIILSQLETGGPLATG